MTHAALVAIDWGTTSARAYRISRAGEVIDTRSAPLGISHVADGRFDVALAQLLGEWREEGESHVVFRRAQRLIYPT